MYIYAHNCIHSSALMEGINEVMCVRGEVRALMCGWGPCDITSCTKGILSY